VPSRSGRCTIQKRRNVRCMCINIIYRQGDYDAIAVVESNLLEESIRRIINSNFEKCCPLIRTEVSTCVLNPTDWTKAITPITQAGSDEPALSSDDDFNNLFETEQIQSCLIDSCLNIVLIRFNEITKDGIQVSGKATTGGNLSAIDPVRVFEHADTIPAHEAGHALGLDHVNDVNNLMNSSLPVGTELTTEQCDIIFDNIDRFACPPRRVGRGILRR